ncbi:hypothetical protein OIU85_004562 [Salix viminalis]|uniref:RING-type E3 ubiquitin transferase n=1 Tax=Salix viminalis TaxID=40686 RepID=A0A9Q0PT26_SALVM|nr:hypothetical protein OIU85_004562 [Salix viminalis]
MGSTTGDQNPWAPYSSTYKDCSQGICSIYCPQRCYIIFPPPPPFTLGDDDSNTDLSPLIIAVIGILASAFILLTYYTLISKYCRRRGQGDGAADLNENHGQMASEAWQGIPAGGLDEALVKSITVCKYKRGDGFVEGTDCSVCLSEFQENESLRLLPKCSHAFHLPCIDTWLKSHATCPLCRANIAPANILPSEAPVLEAVPAQENLPRTHLSTLQFQPTNSDTVLILKARRLPRNYRVARSSHLEDDDEGRGGHRKNGGGGILDFVSGPFGMKRSFSTGRFMFTSQLKSTIIERSGNNSKFEMNLQLMELVFLKWKGTVCVYAATA